MRADPARGSPTSFAQALFAGLPARYDRLAAVLSLGQDGRWRREMIDHIAASHPATVLDVATGPAGVALALAERTEASIIGIDVSADMLGRGQRNVVAAGRTDRISLVLGQGERLPFADATFDALTFTYLLRYVADPAATIAELARVVRPGGTMASLEFAVPPSRFWRAWWCSTRAPCFPSPVQRWAVDRGSRSVGSSGRTSPTTTGASRSRRRSQRGRPRGSRTWALGE